MKMAFLVYDARSGSTLLAAMLNRISGIKVMPETNFPSRILDRGKKIFSDANEAINFLKMEPHFIESGIDCEELALKLRNEKKELNAKIIIENVIATYFNDEIKKNNSVAVIKCGEAIFHMETLQCYFPHAHFIHIYRDGRAVCASKIKTLSSWGRPFCNNIISNALNWKKRIEITDGFTGNMISVKYEDLVQKPNYVIEYICEQLHLPKQARQLCKDYNTYLKSIGKRQQHLHYNIGTPDPKKINQWKNYLSWKEIAIYENIARRELISKGYAIGDRADWSYFKYIKYMYFYLVSIIEFIFHILRSYLLNFQDAGAHWK